MGLCTGIPKNVDLQTRAIQVFLKNSPTLSVESRVGGWSFLNGLFPASAFPRPAAGRSGTLGRNTFRGPRYLSLDASLSRAFGMGGRRQFQVRIDVYNALNTLNLFLPNADLSLSNFGKSTQAFDARTMQVGARFFF